MSDYATPFADKLLDDKSFDTIFGGEIDDQLMGAVLKENDNFDDQVDTSSIEDDLGPIGSGDGHGSDLGPGHDTTGGMKPTDDSSDQEILGKVDSYKQAHVIDASKSDPTQKGADGICDRCIDDESDELKKVNSFEDAYSNLLKELAEEEYDVEVDGTEMTAGDPAPVGTPAEEEPTYAAPAEDPEQDLVDALEDESNDPIEVMVGEEADEYVETRDFESVGDKGEDNLGDNLGPDNDTTGGMKPADDSSDEEIIAAVAGKELKDGQLNAGDNAWGKIEDGSNIDPADARVAGDTADSASDSFEEIAAAIMGREYIRETDLEDSSTTEAEEDEIVDSVEEKDPKPEFAVDELNEDEDDEIMDAVMGGRA